MAADWTVDTDDAFEENEFDGKFDGDFEEDDEFDDEDEWDDDELLYLKYCFDGSPTLEALAEALLDLAITFEERAVGGWSLAHPVDSGWVSLRPPVS